MYMSNLVKFSIHVFADIDECSNETEQHCSLTQRCVNSVGAYDCVCLPGYTENMSGTDCEGNGPFSC